MSRSRNIKPGFFKNDLLAELPFEYRLLFQGLWCEADREGKLEDRPKRIKGEIFPYDSVDVDAGLGQLHKFGFISRYVVGGVRYIKILAFSKHQNPHKKEAVSTIPDPAPEGYGASTVQAPEIPERAGLIPDSPFLIPDSLQEQPHVQPSAARSRQTADRFDEFWLAYPNKKGKAEAEKRWRRDKLDSRADEIIGHVRMMTAQDDQWQRGYAPMGSTYLNQSRWTDVPQAAPQERKAGPGKRMQAILTLEAMKNGTVDSGRDRGWLPEARLLGFGQDAASGADARNGNGVDGGDYVQPWVSRVGGSD